MGSEVSYYFSVFLRRFHYFALVAAVVSAAGIATAFLLPTKFYTDALLLIEPPQIPQNLASSTVVTSPQEQLEIMQKKLLTRSNLLDIANKFQVFKNMDKMYPDEIVADMLSATTFRMSVGKNQASLFTIGFNADEAQTTTNVVNDFVTRVLESNAELRKGRAEDTMQFFNEEVARLGAELAAKNAEILKFNKDHVNALPQNMQYNLSRLDAMRQRKDAIDREIIQQNQQRERLILVFNATGGTGQGNSGLSPEAQQLAQLKQQYAAAVTVYSDTSSRLTSLKSRIAQLEKIVADQSAAATAAAATTTGTGGTNNTGTTMLDVQLDQVDSQIESLNTERATVVDEIARLEKVIDQMPANQVAQDTLLRDYQNVQNQYNQAISRAAVAATGERIEFLSKGERISVINPPILPREPTSPKRLMIAIGSVLAGIAMGIATVIALELLNRSIRRPIDLSKALGIIPIATLPVMRTPGEIARRRAVMAGVIMSSTAGIVAGIVFVHTQVMPLDLLVDVAVKKLGG